MSNETPGKECEKQCSQVKIRVAGFDAVVEKDRIARLEKFGPNLFLFFPFNVLVPEGKVPLLKIKRKL